MEEPKALVGRKIIVYSVVPPKELEKFEGILKRPVNLLFSWKSKRRKGAPCEAFINEKITGDLTSQHKHLLPLDEFIVYLTKRFKQKFGCTYKIIYDATELIKGKRLFGECSEYDKCVREFSHTHRTNQTEIRCKELSALCYPDVVYAEEALYRSL